MRKRTLATSICAICLVLAGCSSDSAETSPSESPSSESPSSSPSPSPSGEASEPGGDTTPSAEGDQVDKFAKEEIPRGFASTPKEIERATGVRVAEDGVWSNSSLGGVNFAQVSYGVASTGDTGGIFGLTQGVASASTLQAIVDSFESVGWEEADVTPTEETGEATFLELVSGSATYFATIIPADGYAALGYCIWNTPSGQMANYEELESCSLNLAKLVLERPL